VKPDRKEIKSMSTKTASRSDRLTQYARIGMVTPVVAVAGEMQADVTSGTFTGLSMTSTAGVVTWGSDMSPHANNGWANAQQLGNGLSVYSMVLSHGGVNTGILGFLTMNTFTANGTFYPILANKIASAGQTFNQVNTAGSPYYDFFHRFYSSGNPSGVDPDGSYYVMFKGYGNPDWNGWVEYEWQFTDGDNWSLAVTDWAYSDDGVLAAGSYESSGSPAVPGLGGLAALACGAAGVRSRRQRHAG
jgi:hypothetical protein